MYLLRVCTSNGELEFTVKESDLNKIQVRQAADNTVIATTQEYFSVPTSAVWSLSSDQSAPKSSLEVLKDASSVEDLEILATLLREGLHADPTPFKRVGAAKAALEKLQRLIHTLKPEPSKP